MKKRQFNKLNLNKRSISDLTRSQIKAGDPSYTQGTIFESMVICSISLVCFDTNSEGSSCQEVFPDTETLECNCTEQFCHLK